MDRSRKLGEQAKYVSRFLGRTLYTLLVHQAEERALQMPNVFLSSAQVTGNARHHIQAKWQPIEDQPCADTHGWSLGPDLVKSFDQIEEEAENGRKHKGTAELKISPNGARQDDGTGHRPSRSSTKSRKRG